MKRLTLSAVVMVLLLGTIGLFAQDSQQVKIKPKFIKNLESGIMSENHGLTKSSIYLAGKYKISELVDVLIKRANQEDDESLRLLVALTLNEINSPEGMAFVGKMANEDSDVRVKKMCRLILNEYLKTTNLVDVDY